MCEAALTGANNTVNPGTSGGNGDYDVFIAPFAAV
jgi:hypothetical protein